MSRSSRRSIAQVLGFYFYFYFILTLIWLVSHAELLDTCFFSQKTFEGIKTETWVRLGNYLEEYAVSGENKITEMLRPLGWEPLIYRQSGRGPGKRTPWKLSDQPTRGHVTVETHGRLDAACMKHRDSLTSLDAACMKHRDNLTSLDAGCRKHRDSLTSLDAACMKHRDNLTSLDAECITWWDC